MKGSPLEPVAAGDFLEIERDWRDGDQVVLDLPMPLKVQANEHQAALLRGPLVYCLFQDLQEVKGTIYWHRGIYPQDNLLDLDPARPELVVMEEPAPEHLLGPVLRVAGQIQPRAPMFSTYQANQQVLPAISQDFMLVPFANQGAIRGPYQIFNHYRQPQEPGR